MEDRMSRPAAVVLAALLAAPTLARADAADCTRNLGQTMAKFVRTRLKAISKCENQRSSGKLPPATICRPQCSTGSDNASTSRC
jgi:hypothetical protein